MISRISRLSITGGISNDNIEGDLHTLQDKINELVDAVNDLTPVKPPTEQQVDYWAKQIASERRRRGKP